MSHFVVIDTETAWTDEVMSVGAVDELKIMKLPGLPLKMYQHAKI